MNKKVLITYTSRYGSTKEVAEKITVFFREQGFDAEILPILKVKSITNYHTVVLGTPFYFGSWPKDVHNFLERNHESLLKTRIAIFCLGPTGDDGDDIQAIQGQIEKDLVRHPWLKPVSTQMFGGKYDPAKLRFPDTLIAALPASPMHDKPFSDMRDWVAIQKWSEGQAQQIQEAVNIRELV